MNNDNKENMNKLLDTLHSQFAENQNHHQGIFIQFLIALFAILTLLVAIILNLGYGFRRDQHLNKKIRQKYLTNGEYEDIFGKLYNSDNKNIHDFLPDFYKIFYWFILGFQIIIFLTTCCKEKILQFENNSFSFLILLLDFSLILISVCLYFLIYRKYNDKIKNAEK